MKNKILIVCSMLVVFSSAVQSTYASLDCHQAILKAETEGTFNTEGSLLADSATKECLKGALEKDLALHELLDSQCRIRITEVGTMYDALRSYCSMYAAKYITFLKEE